MPSSLTWYPPFGSAPKLMEPVMQEGETQYCMPKVSMTLFLDITMNKSALLQVDLYYFRRWYNGGKDDKNKTLHEGKDGK